ncbi:hypothetical protein F4677DRAFT_351703 [Hypoxylon crocopeplum]|nr:hypothetical protein F4677DRAFT_351703 [Hypoxylon crocopeplum]
MKAVTNPWMAVAATAVVVGTVLAEPQLAQSTKCCHALAASSALHSKVLYPNSTAYEARIDSIWSIDAALEPWCLVLPESTRDTTEAIRIINRNQCPFGIRSGGHGIFANAHNVKDGVTIDFGSMNTTTYDSKTNTVSILPGSRWGPVFQALEPYSIGVAGGRQTTVGVAGFLLGGGNSWFNNAYGWGCDTVKNFEVVLADGRVVNANADENRDLWITLKGGSGNFGLVTRFDLEGIPLADPTNPVMWGGKMVWDISVIDDVIDTLVAFADNVESDLHSTSHILTGYASTIGWALMCSLDNIDNKPNETAFDGYMTIPSLIQSTLRSDTLFNIAEEFSGPGRAYNFWLPGAVKNDADILKYVFKRHEDFVQQVIEAIPPNTTWSSLLQLQPISVPMVSHAQGTNSLGLEREAAGGPGIMTTIGLQMETPEIEAIIYPLALACEIDIEEYAAARNARWEYRYLNYADFTYDPIASYGKKSVERMRAVSAQYDPAGVFQHLRKSGFKIPH